MRSYDNICDMLVSLINTNFCKLFIIVFLIVFALSSTQKSGTYRIV